MIGSLITSQDISANSVTKGHVSHGNRVRCALPASGSTGLLCSATKNGCNCAFKLTVDAGSPSSPVKFNLFVRFDGSSFENRPLPCVISSSRQHQSKTVAHFDGGSREESAGSFFADNLSQVVFLRKRDDHFRGAGGMPIHQKNNRSVE